MVLNGFIGCIPTITTIHLINLGLHLMNLLCFNIFVNCGQRNMKLLGVGLVDFTFNMKMYNLLTSLDNS